MLAAVKPTATTVKLTLMRSISAKIVEKYGSKPGAWSRAADDLDISAETLSRVNCGVHMRFRIDWLLALAERVGARVTLTID